FASLSRPQFFLPSPRDPPPLHSFPTRRSSDLTRADRPAEAPPPRHLAFRNLAIDVDKRQVVAHGHPVDLTRQEFDLLQLLASRPGIVFSRMALLTKVWSGDEYVTERTVDTVVSRLRKKIERD